MASSTASTLCNGCVPDTTRTSRLRAPAACTQRVRPRGRPGGAKVSAPAADAAARRARSAAAAGGRGRGLPAGIQLGDLLPAKTEAVPGTHDTGNPRLLCEFFDTRQVRAARSPLVRPGRGLHQVPASRPQRARVERGRPARSRRGRGAGIKLAPRLCLCGSWCCRPGVRRPRASQTGERWARRKAAPASRGAARSGAAPCARPRAWR